MKRRRVILGGAASLSLCLAGCTSNGTGDDEVTDTADDGVEEDDVEGEDDIPDEGDQDEMDDPPDSDDLPPGFSTTGVEDPDIVASTIADGLIERTAELGFEPILTDSIQGLSYVVDADNTEIHATHPIQAPGAPSEELLQSAVYSPPESDTAFTRFETPDGIEHGQEPITEVIDAFAMIIVEDLEHFEFTYAQTDTDHHVFEITGFSTDEGIDEAGFSFDVFDEGKAVIDAEGMVVEYEYSVTHSETHESETVQFTYERVDDVTITSPGWFDDAEFDDEDEESSEPTRFINIMTDGDSVAFLAIENHDDVVELIDEIGDQSAIVLDPDGTAIYNQQARTQWDSVIDMSNQGTEEISTIFFDISVDCTADNDAHEDAISFVVGEESIPATGTVNVLEAAGMDTLGPGETITVGFILDLLNTPIDDIESAADMELVITASS